jgi:hypothetical protein
MSGSPKWPTRSSPNPPSTGSNPRRSSSSSREIAIANGKNPSSAKPTPNPTSPHAPDAESQLTATLSTEHHHHRSAPGSPEVAPCSWQQGGPMRVANDTSPRAGRLAGRGLGGRTRSRCSQGPHDLPAVVVHLVVAGRSADSYRDQVGGVDKDAGRPCPNLQSDFRCRIHDRLRQQGFPGCAVYDCFGAGQKVAQVTFRGQDWRQTPGKYPKCSPCSPSCGSSTNSSGI